MRETVPEGQPIKMRHQDMRLGRLSTGIEQVLDNFKKKKESKPYFYCLLFTSDPKRNIDGNFNKNHTLRETVPNIG